jgi:hypothetical protein
MMWITLAADSQPGLPSNWSCPVSLDELSPWLLPTPRQTAKEVSPAPFRSYVAVRLHPWAPCYRRRTHRVIMWLHRHRLPSAALRSGCSNGCNDSGQNTIETVAGARGLRVTAGIVDMMSISRVSRKSIYLYMPIKQNGRRHLDHLRGLKPAGS